MWFSKRRLLLPLAIAALTNIAVQGAAQAAPRAKASLRAKHVFIISFDGGKPAVMQRSPMPLTLQMAAQGASTWKAQTVVPSITLVSHTSMLTGVQPAKHHILWNDWVPQRGLVQVPTVFGLAHAQGYRTALFAGKPKFRHLNVPGTLDRFDVPGYDAQKVATAAAAYIVAKKPNLCFIHFADSDGAGHKYGWGTPEQIQAFNREDRALQIVRAAVKKAGLEKQSVFILSADHGGHARTHGTTLPADMTIPWTAWGASVRPRFRITSPVSTCDTAATALWLLGVRVPAAFDGKPVISAFK